MNNGTSISRTDMWRYLGLYKKCDTAKEKRKLLTVATDALSVQDMMKLWDEIARWNDERNERNNTETK